MDYTQFYKTEGVNSNVTKVGDLTLNGGFDVHPMANIVPLDVSDTSIQQLADSINRTGLIDAITMYKGKIIDGRRRAIACASIGYVPRIDDIGIDRTYTEKELYDIVLGKNTHRSISKAQQAIIAVREVSLNKSHKLMGMSALAYALTIWGTKKGMYEQASYVFTYGRTYAEQIFETGYATINGNAKMSLSKVFHYLKALNKKKLDDKDVLGENTELAKRFKQVELMLETLNVEHSKQELKYVLETILSKDEWTDKENAPKAAPGLMNA